MKPLYRAASAVPVALLLLISIVVPTATCAVEKPVIAMKKIKVADSIAKNARPHLQLDKLHAEIEASLTALHKFNVVTRRKEALQQVREEEIFATTDAAAGDAAEPGNLKNADYLLLPEVTRFAFYSDCRKVPNLENKYFRTDHGSLEVSCQILDSRTGEIKTTITAKKGFSSRERMVNGRHRVPSAGRFATLAEGVAAKIADQLVETVFPIRIITIKEETLYLNRGKDGGLHTGDILNVYSPGETLVDPDTGEKLGTTEEYVGRIKVSRVSPKFTTATILPQKRRGEIAVGCIVRKP